MCIIIKCHNIIKYNKVNYSRLVRLRVLNDNVFYRDSVTYYFEFVSSITMHQY